MLDDLNPDLIQDVAGARQALILVLNIVEELKQENAALREENQRLRDEINRLKGEQGKPTIKASKKTDDHSSEKERQQKRVRRKRSKRWAVAGPPKKPCRLHSIPAWSPDHFRTA